MKQFYLYLNLTKPTKFLFLSWAKVSGEGKSLRPSYLIQELMRLFPDLKPVDEEEKSWQQCEMTRRTGILRLAEGLREKEQGLDAQWKELYTWFAGDEKSRSVVEKLLRAGFYKKEAGMLGSQMAEKLYLDPERVSVTRLEKFASCAYAHFLSYGLRLSDRETYGFEAMDLGNIAHQALERFARKAEEEKLDWVTMPEERRTELIDESVESSVLDYGNTVLFSSARNEYMIYRIKRLIRRSVWALTRQMEQGDFKPAGYEFKFGSGKIDRIDTCEDENRVYVKVTDYKTGRKVFDITSFYHGLQLQLPVYLNAALETEGKRYPGKEIVPAGIFYYRIQDPIVAREKTDEKTEESILKELKLDGLVNGEEEVIEHLEANLTGSSLYYPLRRNQNGLLGSTSKALPQEKFETVLAYTRAKQKELKAEMYEGEVSALPYLLGEDTGCDFCACKDICGFDQRIEGCEYRQLQKYSLEEAVECMKEKLGIKKSQK